MAVALAGCADTDNPSGSDASDGALARFIASSERFKDFPVFWAGAAADGQRLDQHVDPLEDYRQATGGVNFLYGVHCLPDNGEDAGTCGWDIEIENRPLCDQYARMVDDGQWFRRRIGDITAAVFAETPDGAGGFGWVELYTAQTTVTIRSRDLHQALAVADELRQINGSRKNARPAPMAGRLRGGKPARC